MYPNRGQRSNSKQSDRPRIAKEWLDRFQLQLASEAIFVFPVVAQPQLCVQHQRENRAGKDCGLYTRENDWMVRPPRERDNTADNRNKQRAAPRKNSPLLFSTILKLFVPEIRF
jgi:hypothetical protein